MYRANESSQAKYAYDKDWPAKFGTLLPQKLSGRGNQCRNSLQWPFFVSDPICAVKHRSLERVVFDICAVPLCAQGRKSTLDYFNIKINDIRYHILSRKTHC